MIKIIHGYCCKWVCLCELRAVKRELIAILYCPVRKRGFAIFKYVLLIRN